MKIGIQVSSLKPLLTTPEQVREAFGNMAALGCRSVQLQWIHPAVPAAHIAEVMAEFGMISLGTQDFYERVCEDLEYYVNLNAATGGKWLTVSRIPEGMKSPEGLNRFAEALCDLRERLAPLGQELLLHPVSADYTAVPGMNAVEYLLERLPWLGLCLDGYHLNRCCPDMPGFIRRYAGRIPMFHFKDSLDGRLVPAGSGEVDWTGVAAACRDADVAWGLAEQETWDGDPYACLGQAMNWLAEEVNRL